jgi:xanthine dehydrogenase small subunit
LWVTNSIGSCPSWYVGVTSCIDQRINLCRSGGAHLRRSAAAARPLSKLAELTAIGSPLIRNSGTVGGNVANGSPIGDTPPALIALAATVQLRRGRQVRTMPVEDFFIGYGKQDLRPGEFVGRSSTARDEARRAQVLQGLQALHQTSGGVRLLNIAIDGGIVRTAHAFGGMAATPMLRPWRPRCWQCSQAR